MSISFLAIFIASLLGSLHCVGMCGGFVLYNTTNSKSIFLSNLLYNLGRLVTYCFLGIIAGLLGYALDKSSVFIGISRVSSVAVGILLIYWGSRSFISNTFINKTLNNNFLFKHINSFYTSILKNKYALSESNRSLVLGLLSTLLPCGWLYSYVAIAASTANPVYGAIVMFLFWLGTVPALVATSLISKISLGPIQKHIPRITAVLIIIAGIASIFAHFGLQYFTRTTSCH